MATHGHSATFTLLWYGYCGSEPDRSPPEKRCSLLKRFMNGSVTHSGWLFQWKRDGDILVVQSTAFVMEIGFLQCSWFHEKALLEVPKSYKLPPIVPQGVRTIEQRITTTTMRFRLLYWRRCLSFALLLISQHQRNGWLWTALSS